MREPSRIWPDGRPVGGVNGYPAEYREWQLECQALMVVREMRQYDNKPQRQQVFERWAHLPGVTRDRVQRIWKEGSDR